MFRVRNFNMLFYILRYNHVYDTSVGFCIGCKIRAHVYMYEIHGEINMWHDSFNFKRSFRIKQNKIGIIFIKQNQTLLENLKS